MKQVFKNSKEDKKTRRHIEKYGLSVIMIEATDYLPSFAYSIGLWENFNHPEIISFGLSLKTLHALVNDSARLVKSGLCIETGKDYDHFFENSNCRFVAVAPTYIRNYFGYACDFYNTLDFPALQLVWTDRNSQFPWNPRYQEEFKYRQPLLDRSVDFKFREEKNLGVFTTKQWLDDNNPILRVVHEEGGDWQFLTGNQVPDDARLVCIEEMTSRDITLNEVFDLDYGQTAERKFVGDIWVRMNNTDQG